MAEPLEQAEPTPVNTVEIRRNAGHFEKGNQLGKMNGAGRKPGLERRVREAVEIIGAEGDEAQNLLIAIMVQIASGYRQLIHPVLEDPTTKSGKVEEWEKVSVADQMAAIRWLADRGYGKAKEFVAVEVEDPLELGADPHTFSTDFEQAMDELRERRLARQAREQ